MPNDTNNRHTHGVSSTHRAALREGLGLNEHHLIFAPLGDPPSAPDGPTLLLATLNAAMVGKWTDRLRLLLHPNQTRITRSLHDAHALGHPHLLRQSPDANDPARLWPAVDALLATGPVPAWASALAAACDIRILCDDGSTAVRGLPGAIVDFAAERFGPPPTFKPVFATAAPDRR